MEIEVDLTTYEKESKIKFQNKLINENSKRFVIMMGLVAAFQLFVFIYEFVTAANWNFAAFFANDRIVLRIFIFYMCVILSFVLKRLRRRTEVTHNTKLLSAIKTMMHVGILAFGCYYTTVLYAEGIPTFAVFITVAIMVSITHIRWPYFFNALLVVSFVSLAHYIYFNTSVPTYFMNEAFTILLLLIIIGISNMLNYKIRWNSFVKENKINEMNRKLTELSEIDVLTGIYNRRRILEEINELISRAKRYDFDFCVAMIDLDHFKKVNDKYGHNVGDDILRQFSSVVKNNLRESDVLGRWGGEEFIILIPNTDKDGAYKLIDRIRERIAHYTFDTVGKITFSAGISDFQSEYTDDNIIGNADFALYLSKQMGRNKVSIFANV